MLAPLVASLLSAAPDAVGGVPDLAVAPVATLPAQEAPPETYVLRPWVDGPVVAAAALTVVVPRLLASKLVRERCPCDPRELNGLDRPAVGNQSDAAGTASDVTVALAILGPPLLDLLDLGPGPALAADVGVFVETLLVNEALVTIVKYAVQRPTPRTYGGDPRLLTDTEGYLSFYSSHVSVATAALSATAFTLRLRFGERVWPWLLVGAVGASVAVERVASGDHFPTDVMVGFAAGLAVGVAVPWLHARAPSGLALVPAAAGRGLALAGTF